jgi:hypothetical protein
MTENGGRSPHICLSATGCRNLNARGSLFRTTTNMESQKFNLLGESPASTRTINFHKDASLEDLKDVIASHFAIVVPEGKCWRGTSANDG